MNKKYCWRDVETQDGWQGQYLDDDGKIVIERNLAAEFESEIEAQNHIEANHELGEVAFEVQG